MADAFKFELVSPERLLVSGEVEQVLVPGAEGDMTMLAHHAPLLTTLRPGLLDIGLRPAASTGAFSSAAALPRSGPLASPCLPRRRSTSSSLTPTQLAQAIKDAEEDVADAKDDAVRDRAQTKLDHLRQVQATLNSSS